MKTDLRIKRKDFLTDEEYRRAYNAAYRAKFTEKVKSYKYEIRTSEAEKLVIRGLSFIFMGYSAMRSHTRNDLLRMTKGKRYTFPEAGEKLKNSNWRCAICGISIGMDKKYNIDHIRPIHMGGNDTIDNIQFLCLCCHKNKTKLENNRYYRARVEKLKDGRIYNGKTKRMGYKDNDRGGPLGKCWPNVSRDSW